MRTDGQADMTKQIVFFRNFANVPKKLGQFAFNLFMLPAESIIDSAGKLAEHFCFMS
jgi:hypothetical protein